MFKLGLSGEHLYHYLELIPFLIIGVIGKLQLCNPCYVSFLTLSRSFRCSYRGSFQLFKFGPHPMAADTGADSAAETYRGRCCDIDHLPLDLHSFLLLDLQLGKVLPYYHWLSPS